jgi:hypothetical protein
MFSTRRSGLEILPHPGSKRVGFIAVAAGFLFAGLCFLKAMPGSPLRAEARESTPRLRAAAQSTAAFGYRTKNIEDIRVGDRVLADNPDIETSPETQVDPSTWRKLSLRAEARWEDGTPDYINVETLQPPEWMQRHKVRVGALVPLPLDLVEMGLPADLRSEVAEIGSCPPIRPGPGRVVLTTVNHLNRYVLELTLRSRSGGTDKIRPTGFHKIYRASDSAWVSAEDLRSGDILRGVDGPITLLSTHRVPATHRVYNLAVEGDHVYNVSSLGLLVHNSCADVLNPGGKPIGTAGSSPTIRELPGGMTEA